MPTLLLTEFLPQELVLWGLSPPDKTTLLRTLAEEVALRVEGVPAEDILGQVMEREALMSTGIGNGLALPHGLVAGLSRPVLTVAFVDPPVDYDALDDEPVDILCMLLSPEGGQKQHLRLVARLARIFGIRDFLRLFRTADNANEAYHILRQEDERHVY